MEGRERSVSLILVKWRMVCGFGKGEGKGPPRMMLPRACNHCSRHGCDIVIIVIQFMASVSFISEGWRCLSFYLAAHVKLHRRRGPRFPYYDGEKNRFFSAWFNLGAACTILLAVAGICMLAVSAARSLVIEPLIGATMTRVDHESASRVEALAASSVGKVVPLLPGINMPFSDIAYMWPALVVVLIVHEAGHALAAQEEGIGVDGFGVFLVMFAVPGAYATLNRSFYSSSMHSQLKVVCAGVWHNLVLALVCAAFLQLHVTTLSWPLVVQNGGGDSYPFGATIISIPQGATGLLSGGAAPGDIIYEINGKAATSVLRLQRIVGEELAAGKNDDILIKFYASGAVPKSVTVAHSTLRSEFAGIQVCDFSLRKFVVHALPIDAAVQLALRFPTALRKFLTFLMHTSFSVGLVNAIPCPYFDGAEIARIIAAHLKWSDAAEKRIVNAGTALLALSIIPSFFRALFYI